MARYNREFLVPYLQDICALYMAKRKLNHYYENLHAKADKASKGEYNPCPEEPSQEHTVTIGRILALILGCFLVFPSIAVFVFSLMGEVEMSFFLFFFLLIGSLPGVCFIGVRLK